MNAASAIKNGDELIFQQVFYEYHEKLYFFVLKKTKSEYLAEETVQITFIKLWNYRNTLSEDFTISTQLFRIATTTLIDLLRKQHNSIAIIKEITPLQQNGEPVSSNALEEKELLKKINLIVDEMPVVQRRVFRMSRGQGMSYKEIASELSISVKTVEIHISKALKRLRSKLTLLILLFFLCMLFL